MPYFGARDPEHMRAIGAAQQAGHPLVSLQGHPYIDQARCLLAERALALGAKVVFFIDHDIVFQTPDVLAMALEACRLDSVVAGLYLTRKVGGTAVACLAPPIPSELQCWESGQLYPCLQLAGGFTAIPASVLERMPVPSALLGDGQTLVRLWFLNDPVTEAGVTLWTGEDSRFSQRARAAGVPLYLDTRPRLVHRGMHSFGLEDGEARPLLPSLTVKVNINRREVAK